MKDFKLLQKELLQKGVKFERGLSNQEIIEIEEIYGIHFPSEYIDFLKIGIPVSEGFYNWRDITSKNINNIKEKMEIPFIDIQNYCDEIDNWPITWGKKPKTRKSLQRKIKLLLNDAPKLIPIYGHRYMPLEKKNPPIFSVMNLDIVYYGENLFQYFEIEFGIKKYSEIKVENIKHVEFWSDAINL